MTADVYHVIQCDGRGPDDEQCGTEGHWPVRTAHHRELRQLLAEHRGWRRRRIEGRLLDLCPDCRKTHTRTRR